MSRSTQSPEAKVADDLQGRLIRCEQRATLIGKALEAFGLSDSADPDRDALLGLGEIALQLKDELEAIERAYIDEANAQWYSRHPKLRRIIEQAEADAAGGAR